MAVNANLLSTLRLATRSLFRQRARAGMTLAAVAFGVVGLVLSGGFVRDVLTQLGESLIHSQLGHVQISKKGFFSLGSRKPEEYLIESPEETRKKVLANTRTLDVLGRLGFGGLLVNGRSDLAVVGEGVEPDKEARLGSKLELATGRQLTDRDRYGMLVGTGVAQSLRLEPGSRVSMVARTMTGAMNTLDFEVVGVFRSFSKDYDARAVRIALPAAQELLDAAGVNVLVTLLKDTSDTAEAAREMQEWFDADGLEVKRWDELNDFYRKAVDLYDRQFGVLRLIILMMVLLTVTNTVAMTVFERTGEFGTMQALGNSRVDVVLVILAENALLGLVGAAAGAVLGTLLAFLISAIGIPMPPLPSSNVGYAAQIRVSPSIVVSALLIGLSATVAACIFPALRVARLPIVNALRHNV